MIYTYGRVASATDVGQEATFRTGSFKRFDLFLVQLEVPTMTCYFMHLQEVFNKAGIVVTNENKHELDMMIHGIVNVSYKDCPSTWKEVKKRMADDETRFILELKNAWKKRLGLSA
jgi:hypothetical protein